MKELKINSNGRHRRPISNGVKQFSKNQFTGKPDWLRKSLSYNKNFFNTKDLLERFSLNTVCREAACPNIGECWSKGEATFIILGRNCSRNCLFCNVTGGMPESVDKEEPFRIGQAVRQLQLDYVTITSVTRDDLSDGGTWQFVETVRAIKDSSPGSIVEILISDMNGSEELIGKLAESGASVIGHNIEMVERLYPVIRPGADYNRSLSVLKILREYSNVLTKSAIMVGLGEEWCEIVVTLKDLKDAGVDIIHIGQYLRPGKDHYSVAKYYSPEEFKEIEKITKNLGLKAVKSGPFVRSSYCAKESYESCNVL